LLVLTDGDDTRLKNNPKYNPEKMSVPDYLVANFKHTNIRVNMIFFTPAGDEKEIALAKKNFGNALSQLEPKGSFVTADDLPQLKSTLKRGIKQKLTFQVLKPDGTPVSDEPIDVTGPGDVHNWTKGLTPAIYTLKVLADKPYNHEIDLRKGDWIVVNLVDGPSGGIAFQRGFFSDSEEFSNPVRLDQNGWRIAVLANRQQRLAQNDRLQIVASLEQKQVDLGTDRIQQVKPRFAWFRLDAEDVEHPEREFSLRWHERIFFPGPVWQFEVPRWIKDVTGQGAAKPTLKAWWHDAKTNWSAATGFRMKTPGNTSDLPRVCSVADGKTVTIESIRVEDHPVEIWPGKPLQSESCLVLRLAYPEGSPYVVDPRLMIEGTEIAGHEHRLYSRANRYTGLFWPVNEDQRKQLSTLNLISIDAFRSEATIEKNAKTFELSRPRIEDQIPSPLVKDPSDG
jgi:hypothetical protein